MEVSVATERLSDQCGPNQLALRVIEKLSICLRWEGEVSQRGESKRVAKTQDNS